MQAYNDTILTAQGNGLVPYANATVAVYLGGTTTPASLFSNNGTTVQVNPFQASSLGVVKFYAVDGRYDIKITGTGFATVNLTDVLLEDFRTPATAASISTTVGGFTRTQQAKNNDFINVKDFGAVGDGVVNDTAAIVAAIGTGNRSLYVPAGIYLISPSTFSGINNLTILGANKNSSIFKLKSTGTTLTFSNSQWVRIEKMGFGENGVGQTIANGYGVQFDTGSGNNTVDDCNFLGFSKDGLRCIGTVGTGLSGHKITNCYFLGNGGNQFYMTYSNDFHIENNQYGILGSLTHATAGCLLDNSSAGLYKGNLHWSNLQGFVATNCNYNTYSLNRFEMSDHENVSISSSTYGIFTSNKCHTASVTLTDTYDNVYFSNVASFTIGENSLFSFSSATLKSRWGINIDAGCTDMTLGKNKIASFSTSFGPVRIDNGIGAGVSCDYQLGGAAIGVAAGTTIFLGTNGAQFAEGATIFANAKKATVLRIYVAVDTAPGVGKNFTYTLRKNSVDTAMTMTISGAAGFVAGANNITPAIVVANDDYLTFKLVTDAGAAVANHRYYIELAEY